MHSNGGLILDEPFGGVTRDPAHRLPTTHPATTTRHLRSHLQNNHVLFLICTGDGSRCSSSLGSLTSRTTRLPAANALDGTNTLAVLPTGAGKMVASTMFTPLSDYMEDNPPLTICLERTPFTRCVAPRTVVTMAGLGRQKRWDEQDSPFRAQHLRTAALSRPGRSRARWRTSLVTPAWSLDSHMTSPTKTAFNAAFRAECVEEHTIEVCEVSKRLTEEVGRMGGVVGLSLSLESECGELISRVQYRAAEVRSLFGIRKQKSS